MTEEEKEVVEEVVTTPEPVKTFTQEDVNGFIAKESKKATEKLLKELGIEDTKNVKEALKAYKEAEESKKSEAQKLKEALEAEQGKASTAEQRATIAEAKLSAIEQGVDSARADKLVKLAMQYDGEDIGAKIKAALADFPEFSESPRKKLDKFGQPVKNEQPAEEDAIAKQFAQGLTI